MDNNKQENSTPPEISTEISDEKKKKFVPDKKWLIVLAVVLGVIILVAAVLAVAFRNKKTSSIKVGQQAVSQRKPVRNGAMKLRLPVKSIKAGQIFSIDILMDTKNSDIVVASAFLRYNPESLKLVEANDEDSVLTMAMVKEKKPGELNLVRGIPGDADYTDKDDGYNGSQGILASLKFKALKKGKTELKFEPNKSNMILDDGLGTPMAVEFGNLTMDIQ